VAAWLAGVALQLQQARLVQAEVVMAVAVAAALAAVLGWRARHRWPGLAALCLALAALGWASTHARAALLLADGLAPALEGRDLVVTGAIVDLPRAGLMGTRFVFETEAATLDGAPVRVPQRLALGWYRGFDGDAMVAGAAEDLRAGDRWQLTVRLKQPHGSLNPHGFDLELWLWERGIRASGSVRAVPGAINRRLPGDDAAPVQRARQALREAIARQVPDAAAAGVLAALVVGDQAAIDRDDWDLFRITGVAHLMSISGLHVTMFAWAAGLALGALWRCFPRAMLAVPTPLAARWGGLALAAAYALLAGWGVPAQRTVWMLAVVALMRTLGLHWPMPAVLLAAAFVVTLLDPWALLQPGFWLSFMAVALLMASEPASRTQVAAGPGLWGRVQAATLAGLRTQAVATVGLAPLSMLFFQQLSLVGFVANLVAIPLVTLLVTPLSLLGVLLPPLWTLAAGLVQGLSAALEWLAAVPWAVWTAAAAPPWAVACGLLAALLAVLPLPWRLRLASLPLLLPLLPSVPRPAPGQFELLAADIGQGTAVLVRTRHHLLVYDSGPAYGPDTDAGGRVLLPLLRARGERQVDLLMLSHGDTDHIGGAASLMAGVSVRALSTSLDPAHPLLAGAVPAQRCQAGQAWTWDGVGFEVLHPAPEAYATPQRPNALSCVLRVQGTFGSALLTGDIEAAQETALVQRLGAEPAIGLLLVPHHGSRTSSTPALLDALAPRLAVVQAGYRSRYGHPAPDVLARYAERGIPVVRSDACGAFGWSPGTPGTCVRLARARYWHHPHRQVLPSPPPP
jgi:competence protein ComEC